MRLLLVVLLAVTFLAPEIDAVQSVTAVAPGVGDSTPVGAKAARCTALSGGQGIAGALDTAVTKNVAGAASAVTGGGKCTPGMAMSPEQLMKQMQAQMGAGGARMPPGMPSGAMAMSPEQLMKQMQDQMAQLGAGGDSMPPGAMAMPPGGMDMAPGTWGRQVMGEGRP